jgi:hypothetical protein
MSWACKQHTDPERGGEAAPSVPQCLRSGSLLPPHLAFPRNLLGASASVASAAGGRAAQRSNRGETFGTADAVVRSVTASTRSPPFPRLCAATRRLVSPRAPLRRPGSQLLRALKLLRCRTARPLLPRGACAVRQPARAQAARAGVCADAAADLPLPFSRKASLLSPPLLLAGAFELPPHALLRNLPPPRARSISARRSHPPHTSRPPRAFAACSRTAGDGPCARRKRLQWHAATAAAGAGGGKPRVRARLAPQGPPRASAAAPLSPAPARAR